MQKEGWKHILGLVSSVTRNRKEEIEIFNKLREELRSEIEDYLPTLPRHPDRRCDCDNPVVYPVIHYHSWREGGFITKFCLKCGGRLE